MYGLDGSLAGYYLTLKMTKRANVNEESTDFSFADRYIEDLRFPKYIRVRTKFPLVEDRKAANIAYSSDEWRRSYRGETPGEYHPYTNLKVKNPPNLSSSEYIFINPATDRSYVPQGYEATSSGIYPTDCDPFSCGGYTNNPTEVNSNFLNVAASGDYYVANNLKSTIDGQSTYIYSYDPSVGRFEWDTIGYQSPTEPNTRFPKGARRKVK